MAGFLLLQFGMTSKDATQTSTTQLAAARTADHTANRGSGRTHVQSLAEIAAATPTTVLPTTTTIAVPETTTTVAPTTTTVAPTTTVPPTTTPVKKVTPTTAKPVTTTTAPPAATAPVADSGVIGDDVWTKLSACEAGGRNDLGAPYYGYFQFSAGTWTALGGTGLPSDHTYDEQKAMAIKLQARSGWGQWPVCSKKIGAA